jgi:hypothetical protein
MITCCIPLNIAGFIDPDMDMRYELVLGKQFHLFVSTAVR